jgi:hypothetical protein
MKRQAISKKDRFEVFKRDGFCCQYCGAVPPKALLEVDHIDPVCNGGTNDQDNLITACFDCNRGKGGDALTAIPKSLAEKAAEIAEREAQIAGYRSVIQAQLDRIENDMWRVADVIVMHASTRGMPTDWLRSIKHFLGRLPLHTVLDAAEIACVNGPHGNAARFRYFCGICWNRIKESK